MNKLTRLLFLSLALILNACTYNAPITSKPTRKVEEKLVGDWAEKDGKSTLKVRKTDERTYVIYYDNSFYNAYHSDLSGLPLISIQDIDSKERKYVFVDWKLSDDGQQLTLHTINEKILPPETSGISAIQKIVKKNRQNPDLFNTEAGVFTRKPTESKSLFK